MSVSNWTLRLILMDFIMKHCLQSTGGGIHVHSLYGTRRDPMIDDTRTG